MRYGDWVFIVVGVILTVIGLVWGIYNLIYGISLAEPLLVMILGQVIDIPKYSDFD